MGKLNGLLALQLDMLPHKATSKEMHQRIWPELALRLSQLPIPAQINTLHNTAS